MAFSSVLHIRQADRTDGHYPIRLRLRCPDQPDLEAEARIAFALSPQEQEDLRWYLEDYLQNPGAVEPVQIAQIESMLRTRGEELYRQVLTANPDTQAIWFAIRNQLADLRIEIASGIAGAAAIPWELMRDPALDCAIALRVRAFVRVQSNCCTTPASRSWCSTPASPPCTRRSSGPPRPPTPTRRSGPSARWPRRWWTRASRPCSGCATASMW